MSPAKRIALVARDAKKPEMIDWVRANAAALGRHRMWATGTTGRLVREACPELDVTPMKSGPLASGLTFSSLHCIVRRTASVVRALPCRTCPIALAWLGDDHS